MTKGILRFCGTMVAWSSAGRGSDASSTPARFSWMPRRRCSPKKVSWQRLSTTSPSAAGYTKGAIYKHFATKEDLFLAVSDRYWRRYFDNFAEVMSTASHIGAHELDEIAERWRQLSRDRGAEHAALGHEFTLYLLRNPDARERVAAKRSEVVEALGKFIVDGHRAARRDPADPAVDVRPGARRHHRLRRAGQPTR